MEQKESLANKEFSTSTQRKEGIWHEFVRYAKLRDPAIYGTRLGRIWLFAFIIPFCIMFLGAILVTYSESCGDFFNTILSYIPTFIIRIWGIGFGASLILYFIACIWHYIKYRDLWS